MSEDNYSAFVINKGDEYVCICGGSTCHMGKKMGMLRTVLYKSMTAYNAGHVRTMYNQACKWPVANDFSHEILRVYSNEGNIEYISEGFTVDNYSYASRNSYSLYQVSHKLMGTILNRLTTLENENTHLRYQLLKCDQTIYMSKIPSDILRIIMDFTRSGKPICIQ